ncbi:hypothetical protein APHWI1_0519 [Anaplasma phagocytophilum str. ApWI1]|uniref:Uncharacterized protein n=2 Tax=Anaplasma phagocytophilum TaxID=948 RepID=A0A0F3N5A0_ANAPH|nr:hypothetical protein APHWEB_0993 [Anaplasma phagocytophilum str. Webster]KJV62862.1 hypothetical protein EPHNCH_1335 [Anaplasma phagocytophilum str. NCH-1]KJV82574.1 hypothetical protein APHHGE2_1316 [Anaplasma phagocytophilum str. HGE2]KJV84245.1 hypothetical protein APHWI1_0519 [Anaplasma phagocytophilum str. ApWI1]KJV87114.1 hypothetical protein APHNYW_1032 [Anaplasma phagocytophilum str. ApNYW]KJV98254.1 hypothetical protein OTSANNIE_1288 [Anaplasma phagocytophilum str. Annie]KJZ98458.
MAVKLYKLINYSYGWLKNSAKKADNTACVVSRSQVLCC